MNINIDPIPHYVVDRPDVRHLSDSSTAIGTEPLPAECVKDVLVNEDARSLFRDPAQAEKLLNKQYLMSIAVLSSPNAGISRVSYSHGRSIDRDFQYVGIGDIVGSTILEKGGGFSGAMTNPDIAAKYRGHKVVRMLGLQTLWDAQGNTEVSNRVLAHGGRWSLSLGTITLHNEPTFAALTRLYKHSKHAILLKDTERQLAETNGTLALSYLVGPAEFRLENIIAESPEETAEGIRLYVAQGANTMLEELHQRSPQASRALDYCPNPQAVFDALDLLSRTQKLSPLHTKSYNHFIGGIFALDNLAFARATLNPSYSWDLNGAELGNPKDVDIGAGVWDGDAGYHTRKTHDFFSSSDSITAYMRNKIRSMETLISQFYYSGITTTTTPYEDGISIKGVIADITKSLFQSADIPILVSV